MCVLHENWKKIMQKMHLHRGRRVSGQKVKPETNELQWLSVQERMHLFCFSVSQSGSVYTRSRKRRNPQKAAFENIINANLNHLPSHYSPFYY